MPQASPYQYVWQGPVSAGSGSLPVVQKHPYAVLALRERARELPWPGAWLVVQPARQAWHVTPPPTASSAAPTPMHCCFSPTSLPTETIGFLQLIKFIEERRTARGSPSPAPPPAPSPPPPFVPPTPEYFVQASPLACCTWPGLEPARLRPIVASFGNGNPWRQTFADPRLLANWCTPLCALMQVANGNFIVGEGDGTCSYIYPAGFNK